MKIKNAFSIVAFLLSCMEVYPQDVQNLVIWTRDGGRIVYALDEKPVTRFVGTDLVLSTRKLTVNYPLSTLQRYTYETNATSVADVDADKRMVVSRDGDELSFSNLPTGTDVSVYSSDGSFLTSIKSGGRTVVSLGDYPAGVYVIKVKDVTYKLMKR
jgi:lipoprotein